LKVNEIYGPVKQGEGKSAGKEVMFVRLALCNLHCSWCDTPYTWNWIGTNFKHPDKHDPKKEVRIMDYDEILRHLFLKSRTVQAVVLSGGEPMVQQGRLIGLLQLLKRHSYWIEVETNGTIAPTNKFLSLVDQINCSPKLSNSDNSQAQRERPHALQTLAQSSKTNFKFVVATPVDIEEILGLVNKYQFRDVYLMPQGRTKNEICSSQDLVQSLCTQHGFHFTSRLHILEHGNKRGV